MNKSRLTTYLALSVVIMVVLTEHSSYGMDTDTKRKLRSKVIEMFKHAYGAYMKHAFPADELMPLSCKGRYRGSEPSRGDVDDSLGNFTLSLIDSLDTLAVLGDIPEFERAISLVISTSKFDTDVIVSVFETNIRVLGGLLGGHVLATFLKRKKHAMEWYKDELLTMATDIGTRLLPAFNTTTGIPYPRINLKHGINEEIRINYRDTCTACAGTMILEFAALSRLTGNPVYEEKAHKAMDYLWNQRHRSSDLVGTVINVHNGDWIRRESGVGAGIDSYYEYVLKAYILLGDDTYLTRFNKHYDAVKKYISQGPRFVDVHMHKPLSTSRNFMDALQAFWPGLQVLKGDIQPAIEVHEMLYQVMQKHNFLPEAFTSDFHVHWGHHPLRPEFVESTYFLYKATGDPHYLEVGQKVIENLEMHARVPCGFAALKDVTRGTHEDQMDSFVLAETFKYLYLMYTDKEDILFDVDDYIFTTEAHLLPLTLSRCNGSKPASMRLSREMYSHLQQIDEESHKQDEYGDSSHNTCPNPQIKYRFNYASTLRAGLKNMVDQSKPSVITSQQCAQVQVSDSRLKAVDFVAGNQDQLDQLKEMGIRLMTMADGRIQLLHTATEALNPQLAEEGLQFMQEMIELSKKQPNNSQTDAMLIKVLLPDENSHLFRAGPAQFGYDLKTRPSVRGKLAQGKPYKMCTDEVANVRELLGRIALIERGSCMFVDKARNLQRAGAIGGIVIDHTPGSTTNGAPLFAMSGDSTDDVYIPMLFLFHTEGQQLIQMWLNNPDLEVVMVAKLEVLGPNVPNVQESISGDQSKESHDSTDQSQTGSEPQDAYLEQTMKLNKLTEVKNGVYMSLEEATSSGLPPRITEDEDGIINIKSLADGSRQLFFRFDKLEKDDKGTASSLEDIFENLRTTLMEKTNFKFLNKQDDYLTAIVRLLEVAYFRKQTIDQRSQDLFQELSNELEIFPAEDIAATRHLNSDQSEELLQMDDDNSDKSATEDETVIPDAELEEVNVIQQGGIAVKIRTKIVKPVGDSSSTTQFNVENTHSYADENDFEDSMKSYHQEESSHIVDLKELTKDKLQKDAARYLDSIESRESAIEEAMMQGMIRKEHVLDNENKEIVNKDLFTDINSNDLNFATLEQNVNRELADGLRQVLEKSNLFGSLADGLRQVSEKSDPSTDQTGSQNDNLDTPGKENIPGRSAKQEIPKHEKQVFERTVRSLRSANSKNIKIESDNNGINKKDTHNSVVNSEHDSGSSTDESGQTSRKSGEL